MAGGMKHITVCICTYKRPELLRNLLERLCIQATDGLFTLSVSVVDNDQDRSAKPVIDDFLKSRQLDIAYSHEPERNLGLLRNLSLENASGDYIAFIDDDERPAEDWLLCLFRTLIRSKSSGVFGPVLPRYSVPPPGWIVKGRLCERPRMNTGASLDWRHTRTGNALLERRIFLDPLNRFDPKFRVGLEDNTLFRKLINKGYHFVWCDEAVVHEDIPASRLTVSYFKKRHQLIGFARYRYFRDARSGLGNALFVLKSLVASIIYSILLPLTFLRGYHHFVKLLIRHSYHKGVLLTFLGLLKVEVREL